MDYKSSDFKKLLDKLQQESWQLELIISGFAIYGLFTALEPLEVEYLISIKNDQAIYKNILQALTSGTYILMGSLLIHVILRGLWIGALGLRYVSGEIDYDHLKYTPKFTVFLKEKVGSFDRYISRLENICSTVFALAFLMVFYFLSYFLVVVVFGIVTFIVQKSGWFSEDTVVTIIAVLGFIYFILVLFLFFDFITLGGLKRDKWTSKYFFPIYRFFGFITLAFLYRPLVYNFLDQKRARWVSTFILPVYLLGTVFLSFFGMVNSNYQIFGQGSSSVFTSKNNYEDQLTEKTDLVQFVSLPSKVIDKPYMRVFIGFNDFLEEAVLERDSTLIPEKDRRGYSFRLGKFLSAPGINANFSDGHIARKQPRYLELFGKLYNIKIDSTFFEKEFVMTTDKNDRFGFETFVDLENLDKGKHVFRLVGPDPRRDKELDTLITIPFWYFPNKSYLATEALSNLTNEPPPEK
ncbi:hypothetical protein [Flagellimonas sp.]|uniref:hypothetical protein n=1 Tax=Flagellimonas sp. TaxID=2058762 RepID=UPI003F49F6C8